MSSTNITSINASLAITTNSSDTDPIPLEDQITYIIIILVTTVGSIFFHILLTYVLRRIANKTIWTFDDDIVEQCKLPTRCMFPLTVLLITLPLLRIPSNIYGPIRHALIILLILTFIWLFVKIVKCLYLLLYRTNDFNNDPNKHPGERYNVHKRTVETQLIVMRRLADFSIWIIGLAAILLTFPNVWELGISFLASAGIGAIVVGLAAKPVLENLIGSVTIAFTNPIIIDDLVVIDGEAGVVEEITFQYVVVRTSDDRRMIVPLMRFLSTTFENWSRGGTEISMKFIMYVDYLIPLGDIRGEFLRIVEMAEEWDRRVAHVMVSDCTERSLQLTFTVSASTSERGSDLVNEVREKMVAYVAMYYSACFPRKRSTILKVNDSLLAETDSGLTRVVPEMGDPLLGRVVNTSKD